MSQTRRPRVRHAIHVMLVACGSLQAAQALAGEVDADAVELITASSQPVLYSAWGSNWVERINQALVQAAHSASNAKSCDRVRRSALDHGRSVVGQRVAIVVECANKRRFNIEMVQPLLQGAGS